MGQAIFLSVRTVLFCQIIYRDYVLVYMLNGDTKLHVLLMISSEKSSD